MKRNLFLALLLTIVALPALQAQNSQEDQLSKIERKWIEKQERERKDSLNFIQLKEALIDGSFVLEASSVRLDVTRTFFVTPNLNFLMMRGLDRGIVQIGQNGPIVGPNGVGGITVEGNIDRAEISTDKRGNVVFAYDIWGVNISAKVTITLYKNSSRASAVVRPNFTRYDLYMDGDLKTLEDSAVFEGRSL